MPTLHWWTGVSSVSPYVITITWGIASDTIIHHWSNAYDFSHIVLCLVTFPLPLLQLLQNCYLYFFHCYLYFHTTLLLNTLLQILSYPGVVELTTQLLILQNILWLPLCRINKFGLNTLPSKTVAIPYTCGLSRLFSGTVAGERSSILWVTWDLYLLITMRNLKDERTKIFPSKTSKNPWRDWELASSKKVNNGGRTRAKRAKRIRFIEQKDPLV